MSIYFLLIHEVSHIIKTQKLIDLVNKNIRMNHYFNKVVDNLKRMYNENDLNEEIYAEICAKIFRNKEFIMSLSAKNTLQSRNLIKKIYKSLKKIFNSITKEGRYENFVQDLEAKWRESYITQNNNLDGTRYHVSQNSLSDINSLLNGNYDTSQDIRLRDYTPKELVNMGIKNLPMLMNSSHVLDNILTEQEAKDRGIYKPGTNYHKLGIKNYLEIINAMDSPAAIYQWISKPEMKYGVNDYVVLTNKKIDGKDSIVPIYIETKGNYNYARLDTNKIKSVYNEIGLESKFEQNVKNGNMIKVYDNKKTNIATTINNAATGNSFITNNIPQSNTNVKLSTSSTKYFIQKSENDTKELESSSF